LFILRVRKLGKLEEQNKQYIEIGKQNEKREQNTEYRNKKHIEIIEKWERIRIDAIKHDLMREKTDSNTKK
jgi:hypothetical protein